jgi:S-adenosylmethionine decarboxylase
MRTRSGMEWLVDARGCSPEVLTDRKRLTKVLRSVIDGLALTTLGRMHWHRFPVTGGLTAVVVLKESHLACHTFPETGVAAFSLYVCRPRPRFPWRRKLREQLGARRVSVVQIPRCGI